MRVIDFFDKGVSDYPNNLALVEPGSQYTYAEAAKETHCIATAINGHGYLKGSKIGILAPNSNVAFLTLLGLMRAEAIWLPINPRNSIEVNVDLLHRFEGELLFYHSKYERDALQIKEQVPGIRELVLIDAGEGAATSLDEWSQGSGSEPFITGPESDGDLLALFPTGGTTGLPKSVMMTHPAVQDCSVIGVPDEKWGEAVKAIIQAKPGVDCQEQSLIELCKAKLGGVKTPKSFEFREQLPRSPAGKVLKNELRKTYWQDQGRAVN